MNRSRCTYIRVTNTAIVTLVDDVDPVEADVLQRQWSWCCQERLPTRVILDLGAVSYIGSAGLSLLLQIRDAVMSVGGQLIVAGISPPAFRLLQVTGMDHLFEVGGAPQNAASSSSHTAFN